MLPDLGLLLRAVAALAIVLALIAGATWLARRYLGSAVFTGMTGKRRLGIVESLPIDGRSRLVLVRRDDQEHLLVLGQNGATVVEANLPASPVAGKENGPVNLRAVGKE